MDEPLGAIDAITRAQMQAEIRELHRRLKKTILFVTHDVDEALLLADEIVVLRAGELAQAGPPCELLTKPADDFVRALMGADDRVRQLGLLRVEAVMGDLPEGEGAISDGLPRLPAEASLRDALSLFLQPGPDRALVMREGRPVGLLSLDHLRSAGCRDSTA
jgi:osmoprotectant transport system ATP-binding protein